jgi:hypothetical protein
MLQYISVWNLTSIQMCWLDAAVILFFSAAATVVTLFLLGLHDTFTCMSRQPGALTKVLQ